METLAMNMKICLVYFLIASTTFALENGTNHPASTKSTSTTAPSGGNTTIQETPISTQNDSVDSGDMLSSTPTPASDNSTSSSPSPATSANSTTTSKTSTTASTTSTTSNTTTTVSTNSTTTSSTSSTASTNSTTSSTSSTASTNSTTPSNTSTTVSVTSPVATKSSASTLPPSASSLSPVSTQNSSATSTVRPPNVQISETNIQTWKDQTSSSSWFIELSGPPNQSLNGLLLTVLNGAKNATDTLLTLHLTGQLDADGFDLLNRENSSDFGQKVIDVPVILLLLSVETPNTVLDYLMYATDSNPDFDPELSEQYQLPGTSELIFSMDSFDAKVNVSLSRCQAGQEGFVLVPETPGNPNKCTLDRIQVLQMKLTSEQSHCDSVNHPDGKDLKASLMNQIITGVNSRRLCGLTPVMLPVFEVTVRCKDKKTEIPVTFTVSAAFEDQIYAVMDGYRIFVEGSTTIILDHLTYDVLNCTQSCFKDAVPDNDNGDDHKIRVTIAVVVSCIGVFLAILLCVIIYMKRKRRGILQFRMTRLDEDDDDLIGDMDDFVGNHGPTFSSFK